MDRPGHGFTPPMAFEQPGDRTFVNLVADLGFKSAFDLVRRGNFPALGSREKGREERLLFFPAHTLTTATSFASCLDRNNSEAIVTGNHPVNHRDGRASVLGNGAGFSGIHQGVIDDQPALPTQGTWVQLQSRFDFLC
jgi:hypothetical protein